MDDATLDIAPPAALQLVGHPLRWRLLGELAHSDLTVNELAARLREPHNLVSYHLGKLRDGRVVTAQRSAADRRDAYYTVDVRRVGDLLAAAAGALHPALRRTPTAAARARVGTTTAATASPRRVLFLCTGNSARSPMAEALLRDRLRERADAAVVVRSAGSTPKAVHPLAVRAMREVHGIDLSAHVPTRVDALASERFDWVISLCDRVREVCPPFDGVPEAVHWSTRNPADVTGDEDTRYAAFRRTAEELDARIALLLARLD